MDKDGNFLDNKRDPELKYSESEQFKPKMDMDLRIEVPKANDVSSINVPTLPTESSLKNPKLEAICNKSATEVTKKLFSQLRTMDKANIKDLINNPTIKYETALKTHARIKLRAQMHKQMKALSTDIQVI